MDNHYLLITYMRKGILFTITPGDLNSYCPFYEGSSRGGVTCQEHRERAEASFEPRHT